MSTTRSQLYRFARDLGNVEAVEHGYRRGGLSGAGSGAASEKRGASSTARETARSTASSAPSGSDRGAADVRDGRSVNTRGRPWSASPVASSRVTG